jgi:uncharacterized membrane protein YsdA (DUF1294 family)/cold shock CspA family protein
MRFDGILKSWNDDRGFGFIEPRLGGQEIFAHIKSFPNGTGRPTIGLSLSFEVELGADGKKRAKAIQFARQTNRQLPGQRAPLLLPAAWTWPRLLAIPAFALLYCYVLIRFPFRPGIAIAYGLVSVVAFMAYAIDKSAAVHARWRIPERMLHFLGLACGWPGALLAQQFFRHKTSKASFVFTFWVTVLVNVAGFYAVHSPLASDLFILEREPGHR